jgi:hypothetical protein
MVAIHSCAALAAYSAELARKCVFAERFVSDDSVAANGGTVGGTATFDRGATFVGAGYVKYDACLRKFESTYVVKFNTTTTETFAWIAATMGDLGTQPGMIIWAAPTGIRANTYDGVTNSAHVEATVDYADGADHVIVYVVSGATHKIYFDGALMDSDDYDGQGTAQAGTIQTLKIGGASAVLKCLTAEIEYFLAFEAALSEDEIALYSDDIVGNVLDGAWTRYACDDFGHNTAANCVQEKFDSDLDLTLGDGSTSSTFPTYASGAYTFDGVDDYLGDWPTMPAAYTVVACLQTTGNVYVSDCNDTTIETLLTTSGSFTGKLYSLAIFDRVLTDMEIAEISDAMISRISREVLQPYEHKLANEGALVLDNRYADPVDTFKDYSDNDFDPDSFDCKWSEGGTVFPGSNDNITIGDDPALRSATVTVVAIVDVSDLTGQCGFLDKNGNYSIQLLENTGNFSVMPGSDTVAIGALPTEPIQLAVVMKDGCKSRIFIDGVEYEGTTKETLDDTTTADLIIGNTAALNSPFGGRIDRLAIYNRALSPAEIECLAMYRYVDHGFVNSTSLAYLYTAINGTVTLITRGNANTGFWVDFGDGSDAEWVDSLGIGTDVNTAHTYSTGDEKRVSIYGDLGEITRLDFGGAGNGAYGDISALAGLTGLTLLFLDGSNVHGDISVLSSMTNMSSLELGDTNISGDISVLSLLTGLVSLRMYNNSVSGDISALSGLTSLLLIRLENTDVYGDISALSALTSLYYINFYTDAVSGDFSDLSTLTGLTTIFLHNTNVDVGTDSFYAWSGTTIWVLNNAWNSTQVDNFLIYLDNAGAVNGTLSIAGTNAARTSASDAAKTSLLAAGWTITVNE